MRSGILVLFAVAAASGDSSSVIAQSNNDVVLYSEGHFKGFRMPISGPTQSMDALVVKSVEVPPGSAWDLCSGNTFTGCKRFTESRGATVLTVRSVRPVAAAIPEGATVPAISPEPVKGSGRSLRGFASEFFVMPAEQGNRIEVGPAAGALVQRAMEFCRAHGWRTSPYQREQTVGGRNYLADVLCSDAQ